MGSRSSEMGSPASSPGGRPTFSGPKFPPTVTDLDISHNGVGENLIHLWVETIFHEVDENRVLTKEELTSRGHGLRLLHAPEAGCSATARLPPEEKPAQWPWVDTFEHP